MISKATKLVILTVIAATTIAADAQTLVTSIALTQAPEQIAANALTNRVYVAVPDDAYTGSGFDYLTVIDGKKDQILTQVKIHPIAYAVAVDDIRFRVYVGGTYTDINGVVQNQIAVVNSITNRVLNYVTISHTDGAGIQGLGVNLINGDLWVANGSDNEVDVISEGEDITARIAMAAEPAAVAVNPIAGNAYVTLAENSFDVIALKTKAVSTVAFGGSGTVNGGVAVDLATGSVYVTNSPQFGVGTVGVFNSAGVLQATLTASVNPLGVDTDPLTNRAYVANNGNDTISVVNGATTPASIAAPVNFSASYVAVNPVTQKVYLTSSTNDSPGNFVTVIHE